MLPLLLVIPALASGLTCAELQQMVETGIPEAQIVETVAALGVAPGELQCVQDAELSASIKRASTATSETPPETSGLKDMGGALRGLSWGDAPRAPESCRPVPGLEQSLWCLASSKVVFQADRDIPAVDALSRYLDDRLYEVTMGFASSADCMQVFDRLTDRYGAPVHSGVWVWESGHERVTMTQLAPGATASCRISLSHQPIAKEVERGASVERVNLTTPTRSSTSTSSSYIPSSSGPNCKKGKPCGQSCIAWEKTCHK